MVVRQMHESLVFSSYNQNLTLQIHEMVERGLQGVSETTAPVLHFKPKGSLTFSSAGIALPRHYYYFSTTKSAANACTTKCKRPHYQL